MPINLTLINDFHGKGLLTNITCGVIIHKCGTNTSMMKPIKGYGGDFYELKYGNYRIALYHETASDTFILLHGFKKEKQRESREILTAYSKLREYQLRR